MQSPKLPSPPGRQRSLRRDAEKECGQHIELGGRRKAFTVARKIFRSSAPTPPLRARQVLLPKATPHQDARPGISLQKLPVCRQIFTGRTQGVNFPFHVGFDPNPARQCSGKMPL